MGNDFFYQNVKSLTGISYTKFETNGGLENLLTSKLDDISPELLLSFFQEPVLDNICLRCGKSEGSLEVCPSCEEGYNECDHCLGNGQWECEECQGNGAVICIVEGCDGDGEISVDCETCNGNGEIRVDCEECDNAIGEVGFVECEACDGTGGDNDGKQCKNCEGEMQVKCEVCGGEGDLMETCPECGGEGEILGDCEACNEGLVDCEYCEGEGEQYCQGCDEGYNECDYCQGLWEMQDEHPGHKISSHQGSIVSNLFKLTNHLNRLTARFSKVIVKPYFFNDRAKAIKFLEASNSISYLIGFDIVFKKGDHSNNNAAQFTFPYTAKTMIEGIPQLNTSRPHGGWGYSRPALKSDYNFRGGLKFVHTLNYGKTTSKNYLVFKTNITFEHLGAFLNWNTPHPWIA